MPEPVTKLAIDPRHTARVLALQQLFNYYAQEQSHQDSDNFSPDELKELYEQADYSEDLYESMVAGVKEHQAKIDDVIRKLAPLWPLEQISLIDLVILRLSIWEAFVAKRVPEKVGIDEAIELAKEFTGESSAKFVNGVLGNLLKNEELKAQLHT
jgi:transcription antitermination protein NusB